MDDEGNEKPLTMDEARAIVTAPGFDAYGATRVYATYAEGHTYEGQIKAVKSAQHLDEGPYSRIYTVTRTSVPIRRARRA